MNAFAWTDVRTDKASSSGIKSVSDGHVLRNIRLGIRLAFLRPVDRHEFHATLEQVVLLFVLNLMLALGWHAVVTEGPRVFYAEGLAAHGLWLVSVPVIALLATREVSSSDARICQTTVMLLSPLFVGWVGFGLMEVIAKHYSLLNQILGEMRPGRFAIFSTWAALIFGHTLREATALPEFRAYSLAIFYAGLIWLASFWMPAPVLWYTDWEESSPAVAETPQIDVEGVLHGQRDRVAAAVSGLAPDRPGVVDLYFIGFGSYASQDVFKKEVTYVRDLFDRRFDTSDRSLLLVNHRDTLEDWPIASVSNLEDAVRGVSQVMNPEEDVLVVYLTSHGGRDHDLSVRFPRFPLNNLTPGRLHSLVEEAGIQWPALIISACYSGGYIKDLAAERSLVMTSAAADRTSFGCSNDSELTYFARAYFKHELEKTHDFEAAFWNAEKRIEKWENSEGKQPSQPQMAIGGEMSDRLRRLASRLETKALSSQGL